VPAAKINPGIAHLAVPLDHLTSHPEDPFRGDVSTAAQFLSAHGQYRPLLVQASTGRVIKGSETYLAAKALGWPTVAADLRDLTDADARRILAAEIATSALGDNDPALLAALLTPLDANDLLLIGYADLERLHAAPAPTVPADPGPLPAERPTPDLTVPPAPRDPSAPPLAIREAMLLFPAADLPAVLADLETLARKWEDPDHARIVVRALTEAAATVAP